MSFWRCRQRCSSCALWAEDLEWLQWKPFCVMGYRLGAGCLPLLTVWGNVASLVEGFYSAWPGVLMALILKGHSVSSGSWVVFVFIFWLSLLKINNYSLGQKPTCHFLWVMDNARTAMRSVWRTGTPVLNGLIFIFYFASLCLCGSILIIFFIFSSCLKGLFCGWSCVPACILMLRETVFPWGVILLS